MGWRRAGDAGQRLEREVTTIFLLFGTQCNACCERIEMALRQVKGVRDVDINLYKATATVEHDDDCAPQRVIDAVERVGYLARLAEGATRQLPKDGGPRG